MRELCGAARRRPALLPVLRSAGLARAARVPRRAPGRARGGPRAAVGRQHDRHEPGRLRADLRRAGAERVAATPCRGARPAVGAAAVPDRGPARRALGQRRTSRPAARRSSRSRASAGSPPGLERRARALPRPPPPPPRRRPRARRRPRKKPKKPRKRRTKRKRKKPRRRPAKKESTSQLKKLENTTGKKHTEEVNALGAQPIETG